MVRLWLQHSKYSFHVFVEEEEHIRVILLGPAYQNVSEKWSIIYWINIIGLIIIHYQSKLVSKSIDKIGCSLNITGSLNI